MTDVRPLTEEDELEMFRRMVPNIQGPFARLWCGWARDYIDALHARAKEREDRLEVELDAAKAESAKYLSWVQEANAKAHRLSGECTLVRVELLHAHKELAAARAEIMRLTMESERHQTPYPGEWQPIETAPKDGEHILGFDGDVMTTIRWSCCEGEWLLCCAGQHAVYHDWQPTHWMRLPERPAT